MAKAYQDWKLEDIIAWCQANDKVSWLKTTAKKTVKRPIYPKVAHTSKSGKNTTKYDKTQAPIGYEETPITFVELKKEFIEAFIGKEEKAKKPSMYDIIKAL